MKKESCKPTRRKRSDDDKVVKWSNTDIILHYDDEDGAGVNGLAGDNGCLGRHHMIMSSSCRCVTSSCSDIVMSSYHILMSCHHVYIQVPSKVCKKETVPLCTKQEVKVPKEVVFNNS